MLQAIFKTSKTSSLNVDVSEKDQQLSQGCRQKITAIMSQQQSSAGIFTISNHITLAFQIEDTARKNLTRLKKGINFCARNKAVRPKHRGNLYLIL